MTRSWYNTPPRIAALEAAVTRWLGTPFRENSAICGRGGGVSCHNLAAELYFESGCIPRLPVPRGRARSMLHGSRDGLVAQIDALLGERLAPIDPAAEPPAPGDLVVFRVGRVMLHLGTVVPMRQFAHVLRHEGVGLSSLADTSYTIAAIRRPRP